MSMSLMQRLQIYMWEIRTMVSFPAARLSVISQRSEEPYKESVGCNGLVVLVVWVSVVDVVVEDAIGADGVCQLPLHQLQHSALTALATQEVVREEPINVHLRVQDRILLLCARV